MADLDRDFVELGARIPMRLKLEGIERTQRLFRAAMQGVLPDVSNHRKDKLGLSIPLKNWLREDSCIASYLTEACSPKALEEVGIFRPEAVAGLLRRHRERLSNGSQRLWAILVLQLWFRGRSSLRDRIPPQHGRKAYAL